MNCKFYSSDSETSSDFPKTKYACEYCWFYVIYFLDKSQMVYRCVVVRMGFLVGGLCGAVICGAGICGTGLCCAGLCVGLFHGKYGGGIHFSTGVSSSGEFSVLRSIFKWSSFPLNKNKTNC